MDAAPMTTLENDEPMVLNVIPPLEAVDEALYLRSVLLRPTISTTVSSDMEPVSGRSSSGSFDEIPCVIRVVPILDRSRRRRMMSSSIEEENNNNSSSSYECCMSHLLIRIHPAGTVPVKAASTSIIVPTKGVPATTTTTPKKTAVGGSGLPHTAAVG